MQKMQRNWFDHLKLSLRIASSQTKSPLPVSRRGPYDIGDDPDVPLICPTRQAQAISSDTGIERKLWALERTSQRPLRSQGGR